MCDPLFKLTETDEKVWIKGKLEDDKIKFNYTLSGSFINIAPILETTLISTLKSNNSITAFSTTKQTLKSNYEYVACYNLSPTVAYRSNYLGINTNNPTGNNVLLDINSYGDRNKIYLRSSEKSATIDLTTMTITGLNINLDCGTWT